MRGTSPLPVLISALFYCATPPGLMAQAAATVPTSPAWLGQVPPGETPEPFAPALFASLNPWVEAVDFSPDGKRCLVGVGNADYSAARLLESRLVEGVWSAFAPPSFVEGFSYSHEPVFSEDGTSLLFTGMRGSADKNLWVVEAGEGGWGSPVALPAPINREGDEFRGCYARDGTFWFGSDKTGMLQVYKAVRESSGPPQVSLVGPPVSVGSYEGDPCIEPGGAWLVFYSARNTRNTNLYVCFADGTGGWGPAKALGSDFNSSRDEYGARLSVAGPYLFFTRHTKAGNTIFWVKASAIDKYKSN